MPHVKIQFPDDIQPPRVIEADGKVFPAWEPRYTEVLDHGFIGIVDFMGDDAAIAEGARVSYAAGTKRLRTDRALIRYLMRHEHTSPFEMCEIKWHVKCPIFVARQWHRHRTASINEQSGRYSELVDEFHVPSDDEMRQQSGTNKQGRDAEISERDRAAARWVMEDVSAQAYDAYLQLLGKGSAGPWSHQLSRATSREGVLEELALEYDAELRAGQDAVKLSDDLRAGRISDQEFNDAMRDLRERNPIPPDRIEAAMAASSPPDFTPDFGGLARESAREVLPVSLYTQYYWKTNLLNLFRFLKLRMDPHAQHEIRQYANAMHGMASALFPVAFEAFEDYWNRSVRLSRMEWEAIMSTRDVWAREAVAALTVDARTSQRERDDFTRLLGVTA